MNSFGTRGSFELGDTQFEFHALERLATGSDLDRLPYSIKILIENLLRAEDGVNVTAGDIEALVRWDPGKQTKKEITFTPARVLMQDFTGVPAVVDLAAMREAIESLGGDPCKSSNDSPLITPCCDLLSERPLRRDDLAERIACFAPDNGIRSWGLLGPAMLGTIVPRSRSSSST